MIRILYKKFKGYEQSYQDPNEFETIEQALIYLNEYHNTNLSIAQWIEEEIYFCSGFCVINNIKLN